MCFPSYALYISSYRQVQEQPQASYSESYGIADPCLILKQGERQNSYGWDYLKFRVRVAIYSVI